MRSYHPAFDTLSETELPEYRARGVLLRHRRTGCEVYKLEAAEVENSFAFVFRTPPKDGSGVAHIVEHSVLCGSRAYPVKDSFLVMSRRSLATFLNAFTWPDKTVYPAASAVRQDFWNLLSVYGDAVFHPLLSEETFMQEAHHLEYDEEGRLIRKGVVFNEMRGDYSSADSLAGTASSTSLFSPGHPYSFDSGGDPVVIPRLSYEAFRAFHAERYHPSNCKVFFHGDIPLEEELAFLEERFLRDFEARPVDSAVPVQGRFAEPRRLDVPYPLAEGAEATTQIIVNWLGAEITDELEAFGLELLSEALLGHDGSPLAAALRSSDLGEDLSPSAGSTPSSARSSSPRASAAPRPDTRPRSKTSYLLRSERSSRRGFRPGPRRPRSTPSSSPTGRCAATRRATVSSSSSAPSGAGSTARAPKPPSPSPGSSKGRRPS